MTEATMVTNIRRRGMSRASNRVSLSKNRISLSKASSKGVTPKSAVLAKIVVPTDFSTPSANALNYALALSKTYGSQVKAVHAIDPLDYRFGSTHLRELQRGQIWTAAQHYMNTWLKEGGFLPCESMLLEGDPAKVVAELIAQNQVDLLVLGTSSRKHAARALFGSVAEEIFRNASCPVAVVGPHIAVDNRPIRLKKLVFATDLEPHSLAALPELKRLVTALNAEVFVIRVIHPDVRSAAERYRIKKQTEETIEGAAGPELREHIQEIRVVFDNVVQAICKRAEELDADAIAMGIRSGSPWDRAATHIPWAIAHRVIAEANCPVLTLRT